MQRRSFFILFIVSQQSAPKSVLLHGHQGLKQGENSFFSSHFFLFILETINFPIA